MYPARLSIPKFLLLILGLIASTTVNAGWFRFGSDSWKEEVLLHDGQTIIVKRSQTYGGRYEIGQGGAISGQELSFTLPKTNKAVTFKDEYSEDIGGRNFLLLALHVLNGTPYVVAETVGCFANNKWGRPSPPYLFFRYDGKAWQRITVAEFPTEFTAINLAVHTQNDIKALTAKPIVTAEVVKKLNSQLNRRDKTIDRDALRYEGPGACGEMIYDGKGGWYGVDFFSDKPNFEACFTFCSQKNIAPQFCPCEKLFH